MQRYATRGSEVRVPPETCRGSHERLSEAASHTGPMSPKSAAQKLLIAPNTSLYVSSGEHLELLEPLPEGVEVITEPAAAHTCLLFVADEAALRKVLADHGEVLVGVTNLWFAYLKGNRSDINRDSLWPIVAEHGLRPISQVAVDDHWSALRFRPLRPGEAQFSGGKA